MAFGGGEVIRTAPRPDSSAATHPFITSTSYHPFALPSQVLAASSVQRSNTPAATTGAFYARSRLDPTHGAVIRPPLEGRESLIISDNVRT